MLLLAGCAAGPDFKRPAPPQVSNYSRTPLTATTATPGIAGGEAQKFTRGADIAGDWWTLFHSRPLDALIRQALAHNHDLKAAQAALKAAHEDALAGRGARYPALDAGVAASRQRDPAATPYNLFTPQLGISYAPDVFGGARRAVESLEAQADAVHFQMIATYTTLASNVVVAAVEEAALRAQIKSTRALLDIGHSMLDTVKYQASHGYASNLDVAAQASQLAQAAATLPDLLQEMAQQRNRLAVLCGQFPGQAALPVFTLADLQLPTNLPLSLPSALVAQRPDVRQAQAALHAASAAIGVAAAARLPQIQLTADAGSTALAISSVFTSGTGFWGLAATITAPIFHGGELLHQERAAKATYVQAAEQYRGTVLAAFEDVADTLAALQQDAEALKAAAAAAHAAEVTFQLAQRQAKVGYASQLSLLSAQQAWLSTRITLVQAQASRYADTAALFQALGGGWWHDKELTTQ
ncbi:MAG TPA: efflux transporter outer membrane subunit [Rhodanobacteraceae bacterium]|nr:efflux transporter outer membrane subunit [Rhodanobacteraceae bacterium]